MDRQKVISGFPDVEAASDDAGEAVCAHPECSEKAEFRAPKSRETLEEFYWFCLEHVREYNAGWNYFAGMDDDAIERSVREDTVWRRPTWPLGVRPGAAAFHDPLGILGPAAAVDPAKARAGEVQRRAMTGAERQAMAELGLEPPVSREDVKTRYKILAKTLHPDANGGDKRAEERLKSVNHAYKTLRDSDRLT
jgi:hypothetical protein